MLPVLIHFRDVGIAIFQFKPPSVMPHHTGGAKKSMEKLLPLPCVCQTTPARRSPAFPPRIRPAQ